MSYLFEISPRRAGKIFEQLEEVICMVGHTHELALLSYINGDVKAGSLRKGVWQLAREKKYIVNVGSVGQPRDGNNNAKYVIWDSEAYTLEVRFVPYDIQKTADKIIAAGLPRVNADRLW
jgi:diadenosine tetraphosphatase ApaH/serine/threonine PP2A family protein phosphatase